MKGFIIAANWKMNKTNSQAIEFVNELKNTIENSSSTVIICPSFLSVKSLIDSNIKNLFVGAQNIHQEVRGTYTGEVSAEMLTDLSVKYVLIGHSERRQIFKESDEVISQKMRIAVENGLIPILCIGESFADKINGNTLEVLNKQIEIGLSKISKDSVFVVAYEPVWAISSGDPSQPKMTPTSKEIGEIHMQIKKVIEKIGFKSTKVLYGGSANENNCLEFSQINGVDGFLVGGASLEIQKFTKMIELLEKL